MEKLNAKTIKITANRLAGIREYVTRNNVKNINDFKRIYKGSARMYTILGQENILFKDKDGFYRWDDHIPVTHKLARTLVEKNGKLNREYAKKYNNKKPKADKNHTKSTAVVQNGQMLKEDYRQFKDVKTEDLTKDIWYKEKSVKFSLFFGLIKYEKKG